MAVLARDVPLDELALRLGQQELVAGLGLFALGAPPVDRLLDEACRVAALGLGAEFAKVLRSRPAQDDLLVVAGVGWQPGVVGHATLGAQLDSPAGYALHTGAPVVSNDLHGEGRFRVPALLAEHGVQSAINVPIGTTDAEPFGVLEVDSTTRHDFADADAAFLQSLGKVLAAAIVRNGRNVVAEQQEALSRQVFESSPDCVKVLDLDGRLLAMNMNGAVALGIPDLQGQVGTLWPEWWPAEGKALADQAVRTAVGGSVGRFTAATVPAGGGTEWWDVLVAPVLDAERRPTRLVSISRNVTAAREAEQAKDALLRDKDLLMQEVHHRVKNSLQLVRTLLHLQSRSVSAEAREQLEQAAGRILTIGTVHQRLYEGDSVAETDAAGYVDALLGDMRAMLMDPANERRITLVADTILLTADQITPLGLVVSELVTNAIKYGSGGITVTLRRLPAGMEVVVEDGGPGFPASFDPGSRKGLGMRLVLALAKGDPAMAIRVDRDVAHSRVVATLTF